MPRRSSTLEPILRAIAAARANSPGRSVLIAIDGRGGAGKSTLAETLARDLPDSALIHTDDFALGWKGGWDWVRFQAQVLLPVLEARQAKYQRYDWNSNQLAEWHDLPVGIKALIFEGVSSTRRELADPWDITVWVEAPEDLRRKRGLQRDGAGARHLWDRWMAQEDAWIADQKPVERCDFIIDGTLDYLQSSE